MTDPAHVARNRYYLMMAVQLVATAGMVFGVIFAARGNTTESAVLGGAILLAGMYVLAVVPRAMARRWRTPPEA